MSPDLLAHGNASGLAHNVSAPRSAMACSDRGSAAAVDSSTSAAAVPILSAVLMWRAPTSEEFSQRFCCHSVIIKRANVGQDCDDLAFGERAAKRRHRAWLAVADSRDDEIVAARRSGKFRPPARGTAAVLVAKAAHGREHGLAVDVVWRCLR